LDALVTDTREGVSFSSYPSGNKLSV